MTDALGLAEKVNKFNQQALRHLESQTLNPFSGRFDRSPSPRPKFSKDEYGKPVAGSLTEMRGKKASSHINREVLELCELIYDVGTRKRQRGDEECDPDDQIIMSFGELFAIYSKISDKVVGLLIAAKKRGFVYFEPEILFQRRDDDVLIALMKPIDEIRNIVKRLMEPSPSPAPAAEASSAAKTEEVVPEAPTKVESTNTGVSAQADTVAPTTPELSPGKSDEIKNNSNIQENGSPLPNPVPEATSNDKGEEIKVEVPSSDKPEESRIEVPSSDTTEVSSSTKAEESKTEIPSNENTEEITPEVSSSDKVQETRPEALPSDNGDGNGTEVTSSEKGEEMSIEVSSCEKMDAITTEPPSSDKGEETRTEEPSSDRIEEIRIEESPYVDTGEEIKTEDSSSDKIEEIVTGEFPCSDQETTTKEPTSDKIEGTTTEVQSSVPNAPSSGNAEETTTEVPPSIAADNITTEIVTNSIGEEIRTEVPFSNKNEEVRNIVSRQTDASPSRASEAPSSDKGEQTLS